MNDKNAKPSIGILAGISGFLFAVVYVGLEFMHEMPKGISIYGEANTITVWHFPLIWLLAGILFYSVFYAVRIIRGGKVKERRGAFLLSLAVAALLGLFWLFPMLAQLMKCFGVSGC
jgi:fatty acid desaturase